MRKKQSKRLAILAPIEAKTFRQICGLPRDNYTSAGYWILAGAETIHLAEQKNGEASTQAISVPKSHFDRLVRWYISGEVK